MRFKKIINNINFRMISFIVVILLISNAVACIIGYVDINTSMESIYYESAINTVNSSLEFIDGDKINYYLDEVDKDPNFKNNSEYLDSLKNIDNICQSQKVILLYVIAVDKDSNYLKYRSVCNAVLENNDGGYTPWELGFENTTTNSEYQEIYRKMYEEGLEEGIVVRTKNLNGKMPHITALVPVHNSSDEVVAIACCQRQMTELNGTVNGFLFKNTLITFINLTILVLLGTLYCIRQFTNPVNRIIKEAKRFSDENTILADDKSISRITELNDVWKSLMRLEHNVDRYTNSLASLTAERERISAELELATKIQMAMLPNVFPAFPEIKEIDLYAIMHPAKEVGGDYYDFFLLDDDHLVLTIGDVSGKGVPAALFMMGTKILTNNLAIMIQDPAKILEELNNKILENNQEDMFVTVWLAILEISTGRVVYANAGHEDPVIRSSDGRTRVFETKHGLAVGCFPGIKYKNYEFTLEVGDSLFIYTDGVTEATNSNNQLFGMDRIIDNISNNNCDSATEMINDMRKSIDEFIGDAPQFDDITMLAIKRK